MRAIGRRRIKRKQEGRRGGSGGLVRSDGTGSQRHLETNQRASSGTRHDQLIQQVGSTMMTK
jgi:hypothetical protein